MEEKSNCIFNISGGNIQIVPNATQAVQNFYGDQFVEEALKANANACTGNSVPELTQEEKDLLLYIHLPISAMHLSQRHRQGRGGYAQGR